MKLPEYLISVVVCLQFFVAGCCDTPYVKSLRDDPSIKAFFNKPAREQVRALADCDIDRQYAIFMYGNQVIHPPLHYLAGPFAARGEQAVDYLKQKLPHADDVTIHYIVVLLSEISTRSHVDIASDDDLMSLVDQSVRSIGNQDLRTFTQQIVDELRTPNEDHSSPSQTQSSRGRGGEGQGQR